MSFILDALRKSENERKRNELPGLADARVQQKDKSPKLWIPLVALLLGINLSLLIVMWLTGDQKTAPTPTTPVAVATPVTPPVEPTVERTTEPSPTLADALEPQQIVPALPVAPTASPATTVTPAEHIPSLLELTLDNAINISPLHLDIHVYSEQSEERFVFINMAKYREGERISEGPVITEINAIGVVMKHQGRSFLLLRD